MKTSILERIETWYEYANAMGLTLTRILVHPDDLAAAPKTYMELPVVAIGALTKKLENTL